MYTVFVHCLTDNIKLKGKVTIMGKAKKQEDFGIYRNIIKRLCDIVASLVLVIIALIPGIIIACLIKLTSRGPVFFEQDRVGREGRPFKMYKFRSMVVDAPHEISTVDFKNANKYITRIGNFLRKTSFDELPQLFNVLKGDMSIIGPRPLIPTEVVINKERHELKIDEILPGITGLAQINGRDRIDDRTKLSYDLQYYQELSFALDVRILFKTISNVAVGKDIQD